MPRATPIQTNFTSGEISRAMRGRIDVNRYQNGVEELTNFFVFPQGGAWRRSGTRFVHGVKTNSKKTILQEFVVSNVQAYVLEFGDLYMRVYADGGIVESAPSTPVELVTLYEEAELAELCFAQSADVLYITHPDHPPRKVSRTSNTTWSITDIEFIDGPYMPENVVGIYQFDLTRPTYFDIDLQLSSIVDTATAKSSAALFAVGDIGKYIEYKDDSGYWKLAKITAFTSTTQVTVDVIDELILPDPVAKITVSGANIVSSHANTFTTRSEGKYIRTYTGAWYQLKVDGYTNDSTFAFVVGGPLTMVAYTYPTTTIAISARSITANLGVPDGTAIFTANDTGRLFRIVYNGIVVRGIMTSIVNEQNFNVELLEVPQNDIGDSPPTLWNNGRSRKWRLGAWSMRPSGLPSGTPQSYPAIVTFHEQRLCFARTYHQPQTVWMSVTDDYENFAPTELDSTVLDTNAITYTIVSNEVNPILWMISGSVLLIGTSSSEWQVKASSINEPLTPTNIIVTPQTAHGSLQNVRPRKAANAVLFVQRSGRKIRELVYSFEIDQFQARDLTIISEHILRRGGYVVDMAFQREPHAIMWCAMNDGSLAAITYERDQEIIAWHRHNLGGSGIVESICVVPSASETEDTLYMVVRRTINGNTVRYIEYLETDFDSETDTTLTDAFYVDSGLTYDGAPVSSVSGLDHLEGASVQVLADGTYLGLKTVTAGAISLGASYSVVHAGLGFTSQLKTLPIEAGSMDGTAQGKTKRIHEVTAILHRSYGFEHSADGSAFIAETAPTAGQVFTGNQKFLPNAAYSTEGQYYIRQTNPFPLSILALVAQLSTND